MAKAPNTPQPPQPAAAAPTPPATPAQPSTPAVPEPEALLQLTQRIPDNITPIRTEVHDALRSALSKVPNIDIILDYTSLNPQLRNPDGTLGLTNSVKDGKDLRLVLQGIEKELPPDAALDLRRKLQTVLTQAQPSVSAASAPPTTPAASPAHAPHAHAPQGSQQPTRRRPKWHRKVFVRKRSAAATPQANPHTQAHTPADAHGHEHGSPQAQGHGHETPGFLVEVKEIFGKSTLATVFYKFWITPHGSHDGPLKRFVARWDRFLKWAEDSPVNSFSQNFFLRPGNWSKKK